MLTMTSTGNRLYSKEREGETNMAAGKKQKHVKFPLLWKLVNIILTTVRKWFLRYHGVQGRRFRPPLGGKGWTNMTNMTLQPRPCIGYPASRGFSLVFLSVVLPFSSRFWLLAFCFGCFCAEEKTSADSRLGFLLSMREMKTRLPWNFWVTCR